jgi:ribonuclease HI
VHTHDNNDDEDPIRAHGTVERPSKRVTLYDVKEETTTVAQSFHQRSLLERFNIARQTGPANFVGETRFMHPREAVEYASHIGNLGEPQVEEGRVRLVYYVDGSMESKMDPRYVGSPGAYSVVYKDGDNGQWVKQAWCVDKMFTNNWGELMGVAEALNMAILRLRLMPAFDVADIYVFTDRLRSMRYLRGEVAAQQTQYKLAMEPLRTFAVQLSHQLRDLGARLIVSHIPGHGHNVTGHVLADKTAYKAFAGAKNAQVPSSFATSSTSPTSPQASLHSTSPDKTSIVHVHNGVSSVLQHQCALNLEAFKYHNRPTAIEEEELVRLKKLLALPVHRRNEKIIKIWIKSLSRLVGHFL